VPPVASPVNVTLLRASLVADASTDTTQLASRYVAQLPSGMVATFMLAADGRLTPVTGSACQLSGKASAGKLPGTLALTLALVGCGSVPATASGMLVADNDYAPARLRMVVDDGKQALDVWGYAE